MEGRRTSSNVDDRRGMSTGKAAGLGIGGLLIAGLVMYLLNGKIDLGGLLQQAGGMGGTEVAQDYQPTAQEEALAEFSKQILASTEDVWTKVFREQVGGPFYCSADRSLYIDLSFFSQMKQQLGADGEFAYAYVIAHEVGHHVENLLGTLGQVHQKMQQSDKTTANNWSVRLELQADFLAGVWGYHEDKMFNSIDEQDIANAIRCSKVIGDDYLQKKSQGYTVPDAFTHGTSAQREKWLKRGLQTGDLRYGDTYNIPYSQL